MINWRKPIINTLSFLEGSKRIKYLRETKNIYSKNSNTIKELQNERLEKLLLHAYNNTQYYNKVLGDSGVIKDNKVDISKFKTIPALTKDIIRTNYNDLLSKDREKRKTFENSSGGSTGEPIVFLQDRMYDDYRVAHKLFIRYVAGQEYGQPEIRLWGSERDILDGQDPLQKRLKDWLFNRVELNSFRMGTKDKKEFVERWNKHKPQWCEAYVQSAYEFAQYIDENKIEIHSPQGLLTSAGVLTDEVKKYLEKTFKTTVINRYGSREVGDMAYSCPQDKRLHVNMVNHIVEILNEDGEPVKEDEMGYIHVTLLTNYSMPLIRYNIGDVGEWAKENKCLCGLNTPKIERIVGRSVNLFILEDGTKIDGEYFTHLFYFKKWIEKFQVVQTDYNELDIKIVLNGEVVDEEQREIEDGIKAVMENVKMNWKFVEDIPPTKSGKYLYTISNLVDKNNNEKA